MNLNTSDLRLKKQTVTVNTVLLKKLQQSINKKMKTLRSQGKLTKASFSILCLVSFGLSEAKAITTFSLHKEVDGSPLYRALFSLIKDTPDEGLRKEKAKSIILSFLK